MSKNIAAKNFLQKIVKNVEANVKKSICYKIFFIIRKIILKNVKIFNAKKLKILRKKIQNF